jgi:hypothetical protein
MAASKPTFNNEKILYYNNNWLLIIVKDSYPIDNRSYHLLSV